MVSPDKCLNSSYRPEVEYVDGMLVERGLPTIAHGLLQTILIEHFGTRRKELRLAVLPDVRTQIVKRARYRIPDLMLRPVPIPSGKIVGTVPWVVIETLSPEDRFPELLARFRDYNQIGVAHILLLDPGELIAYRFVDGSLTVRRFTSIALPTGSLPFDTEAIFRKLAEERHEGTNPA